VEQAQKDLETRKKLVGDAIYTLDKCIDYRRAVMNSFASPLVRNENETPEIADLARQLRNRYEEGKSGQEEQRVNVSKRRHMVSTRCPLPVTPRRRASKSNVWTPRPPSNVERTIPVASTIATKLSNSSASGSPSAAPAPVYSPPKIT
jgi:hypothetical protein